MLRRATHVSGLLFSLWFFAGESCTPTYSDCAVRCGPSGDCPSGFECSKGFCSKGATCDPEGNPAELGGSGGEAGATSQSGGAESGSGTGGNNSVGGNGASGGSGAAKATGGSAEMTGGMSGDRGSGGGDDGGSSGAGDAGIGGGIGGLGGIGGGGASSGSGGVGGGGGEDGWTPRALVGLVLWLDAGTGVESVGLQSNPKVEAWRDQSGHANDALQHMPGMQPRLSTGAVNGRPAVEFNGRGTFMRIADSESLEPGTGDFCMEIVGAWTNSTASNADHWGYGAFFRKQQTTSPFTGTAIWANDGITSRFAVQVDADNWIPSLEAELNDGYFRLYGGRRTETSGGPGTLETRVGSVVSGTQQLSALIDVRAPDFPALIGGDGATFQALDGAIAEMVFVRGELSDDDLARLERYLNEKYALR